MQSNNEQIQSFRSIKRGYISVLEREIHELKDTLAITQESINNYARWIDSEPRPFHEKSVYEYNLKLKKDAFARMNEGNTRAETEQYVKELESELIELKKLWKIPS